MLFAYTYVPHAMEKMQAFIDFIFFEVWCKAPDNGGFRLELFAADAELKALMEAFYYSDTQGGDFFYRHVEGMYGLFAVLLPPQIDQLKQWYQANNAIEKVCANDPGVQIARYADIAAIHPKLSQQLAAFFKGLYSQQLLDLAVLRNTIGQIDAHYQAFMQKNTTGKCPFCGLSDIKGVHHSKREAYDHYLPRALYPFNSINFRNLAPVCHECNSTYKLSKDPAHNAHGRRKAFYPYATSSHSIDLTIDLGTADIARLAPTDILLTFGPDAMHEEIDTWKEVYGIEERYKAKYCGSDARDWLEQVRMLRDTQGIAPTDWLATVQQQTEKAPVANSNFLKKAFLEGCQRVGLFDVIAEEGAAPTRTRSRGTQPGRGIAYGASG
ncbi:MAG: HNH endonuclease [Candidatus Tectimicrobiota bacterium]